MDAAQVERLACPDRRGRVDYRDLEDRLSGALSPQRLQWLQRAYEKLSAPSGTVSLSTVLHRYEAGSHPESQVTSPDSLFQEFQSTFTTHYSNMVLCSHHVSMARSAGRAVMWSTSRPSSGITRCLGSTS